MWELIIRPAIEPERDRSEPIAQERDSLNPNIAFTIREAKRQQYRIELCKRCGGPEIFSKHRPISKCFRCGILNDHMAPKQFKKSWRRCKLCNKQNMGGVPINQLYCGECNKLSANERRKRLRWKREGVQSDTKKVNKDGPILEPSSD